MRRYLLVDDNKAFAENLAEIIRDAGDDVVIASSGLEALGHVEAQLFDAMLTDMRMPAMSGAQLVHRVRRVDPGLPAIVVTAFSGDQDLKIARDEGLLGVLQKPVPVPQLLGLLKAARRDGIVVLVEDDTALADNLTEVFRDAGFTTVTSASVAEAERLGSLRPFAAVVDLRVPGGPDGISMRLIAEQFPGLPQLVVTALEARAVPVAAHAVYKKPFDTEVLMREVESLFARRRVGG